MTLFQFLNRIRKEGGDISRIKVRMEKTTGSWGRGYQVSSLSGNRLGVRTAAESDLRLSPGHVALRGQVLSVHFPKSASVQKLVGVGNPPVIIVEITRVASA